jgi:cell division septation protein DedD
MEEQVSWKGQGFSLLVFAGLVFLCSIFFVLGMMVGRGQGQRAAAAAAKTDDAKLVAAAATTPNPPEENKSSIAPYQGVETGKPKAPAVEPETPQATATVPAKAPVAAEPTIELANAAPEKPAQKRPNSEKMIYIQVAALEKETTARNEQDKLMKKGFAALIMSGDGPNKLYHVRVGPFSNKADADEAKRKLEALGYKTLTKQ